MPAPVSTGPITELGKEQSSQNAVTHGLSSQVHLVRPEDAAEFEALIARLRNDLQPITSLENTLFKEIARASWRLERCGRAEDLSLAEDNQPAIDRARATALNVIFKATAELRRLQTNRRIALEVFPEGTDLSDRGILNEKEVISTLTTNEQRLTILDRRQHGEHLSDSFRQADKRISREYLERKAPAVPAAPAPDSSFCKTAELPAKRPVPRNAPCPCGAGKKYKQCCGKNAPPVLHYGAKAAA